MSQPNAFKGPRAPLQHRCAECNATCGNLLGCAGCHLVRYCSRDHQLQHRPLHKSLCKKTSKLREKLQREDHLVRNSTPDFMTPANAFETGVGHFWGLASTRDYMRARFALADEAHRSGTMDGVRECLGHFQDMIQLNRRDNMGLRDKVPALMLRLNRDQECYDFIKWWETGTDDDYDWGDTALPFLDMKDADVMEDPKFLLHPFGSLSFLVATLLLKFKILIDIRNIKVARKAVTGRLPIELWGTIEKSAVQSPLSVRFAGWSLGELVKTEEKLKTQCMAIGSAIVEANKHFMFELLELEEKTLGHRPDSFSKGSYEEMVLVMQDSYPAWWEVAGALDLLRDARACAARDSEDEIDSYMLKERGGRTAQELLEDMSINRIWGYLDYAIENGSYLGPPHDRPSERYTRRNKAAWAEAIAEDEDDEDYGDDDDDSTGDEEDNVLGSP